MSAAGATSVGPEEKAGRLTVKIEPPYCYREFSVSGLGLSRVRISAPGSDLFLGHGFVHRRGEAVLDGENALGLLRDHRQGDLGDVFVRNRAQSGFYIFLETRPASSGGREAPLDAASVPAQEIRKMMRAWGYMQEAEIR